MITFVLPSTNDTDGGSLKLKSNHPYSSLWFFQRIIGFIGVFLNSLGMFTFYTFIMLKDEFTANIENKG